MNTNVRQPKPSVFVRTDQTIFMADNILKFDPNKNQKTTKKHRDDPTPWSLIVEMVILYIALEYVLRYVTEYTVTYALAGVNCVIFLLIYKKKLNTADLGSSYYLSIKCNQNYRLLTSAFTHEHPLHLLFNMYSLSNIAPAIESYLGKHVFLGMYIFFVIIGGGLSAIMKKKKKPHVLSIGASGAICSVLGLLMVLIGFYQPSRLINFVPTMIILILMSFSDRIDSMGHFCGLFIGLLTGISILALGL